MAGVTVDISPFLVSSAGVKTYLYHWLNALRQEARGVLEVDTFPVPFDGEPLQHEVSVFGMARTFAGLARLGLANRGWIPSPAGQPVFHATQLIHRTPSAKTVTATIHDMTYLLFPELHTSGTIECHRRFDAAVLPVCRRVFCVSEATAADARRMLRLAEETTVVIHPGIEPRFFKAGEAEARVARDSLKLPAEYVLCLGTIEPRKNVARLLDVFLSLPLDVQEAFPLIFAGGPGWKSDALLAQIRSSRNVRYLGYVPEEHLPGIVAGASLLAYPSLYEGFGFPLAQAMATGTPILTSNVSSMPEVAGDAAILIDPMSVESIRDGLLHLLTSPSQRNALAENGRRRSHTFTWPANAKRTLQAFREIVDS